MKLLPIMRRNVLPLFVHAMRLRMPADLLERAIANTALLEAHRSELAAVLLSFPFPVK